MGCLFFSSRAAASIDARDFGAGVECVLVPEAGHWAHLQQPAFVAAALVDFVARHERHEQPPVVELPVEPPVIATGEPPVEPPVELPVEPQEG